MLIEPCCVRSRESTFVDIFKPGLSLLGHIRYHYCVLFIDGESETLDWFLFHSRFRVSVYSNIWFSVLYHEATELCWLECHSRPGETFYQVVQHPSSLDNRHSHARIGGCTLSDFATAPLDLLFVLLTRRFMAAANTFTDIVHPVMKPISRSCQ